jgi:UDP-N-acetylglucosamine acyltransferase
VTNSIHPTAIVSPQAELGEGNTIGPFVYIQDNVRIGNNNQFMTGSVVKPGVTLTDNNITHEYAVLGGEPQDLGFNGHVSFVEIGSENVFRESVTIHRSKTENEITRVGNNNFLMANAHIGHDCQLGNHVVIAPSSALGGFVTVDDRAFISGGVMVHQFVHVGRFAMIGGNSKITQDVLPFMTTDGNPAQVHGLNVVGLRRAGFTKVMLAELKQAYRILFSSNDRLEHKLDELRQLPGEEVAHLVEFIGAAKRGFHRSKSEVD